MDNLEGKNVSYYGDIVSWTSNNYNRRIAKRALLGRKMRKGTASSVPLHNWDFSAEITSRVIHISKYGDAFALVYFT